MPMNTSQTVLAYALPTILVLVAIAVLLTRLRSRSGRYYFATSTPSRRLVITYLSLPIISLLVLISFAVTNTSGPLVSIFAATLFVPLVMLAIRTFITPNLTN